MLVHRTSTFIFFMFTTGSYELEKDVVKKEMKNYRKADTESKITIKRDAIQSNDGSIHLYEDAQKKYTVKAPKVERKAIRFSHEV